MAEEGVNGLSLAEVARRLGVQPPSLYKYFPSLMAVYDAIFLRGQLEHLEVMRQAMTDAEPGLAALTAGLEASGRWALANRATAQLMFWRPVPSFEPSAGAFTPSVEMVALQRAAMADAVAAGQLGPGADSDEAVYLVSIHIHIPEAHEAPRGCLSHSHLWIEAGQQRSLTPQPTVRADSAMRRRLDP